MSDNQEKYKCPLCGSSFSADEAKTKCNAACQNPCANCPLISCPSCGYKIIEESGIVKAVKRFFSGLKNKINGNSSDGENGEEQKFPTAECPALQTDTADKKINYEHANSTEKEIDEYLQTIWELREEGKVTVSHFASTGTGNIVLKMLDQLKKLGLVRVDDNHIRLTEAGEKRASNIVRRHRLTERMLVDLFDIPHDRIEDTSCEFEHILSEEVTDSICSFLGHPVNCPHGKLIPRGECCSRLQTTIRALVVPLSELMPGEKGKISFMATKDKKRLQKLSSLGIAPDETVTVQQKLPVMVIRVNETEIAIDKDLVSEIYVKRMIKTDPPL